MIQTEEQHCKGPEAGEDIVRRRAYKKFNMARAGGHESLVSSVKAFELPPKAK